MSDQTRLLAITCEMVHSCDGPSFCAYKQAYGLEMTFDDEWPFETIFMAPPYLLPDVAESVDLESANAVLGASSVPGDRNFSRIADLNGKWVMAWPADPIPEILESHLGCILYLQSPGELETITLPSSANRSNFVVALQTSSITTNEDATSMLTSARKTVGDQDVRFALCVCTENTKYAAELAANPNSDGTLFINVFPGEIAAFVNEHLLD